MKIAGKRHVGATPLPRHSGAATRKKCSINTIGLVCNEEGQVAEKNENMKTTFIARRAVALAAFTLGTAAQAQTLTLNEPITSISHYFYFDGGFGFVQDTLNITPGNFTVDLSQYTTYALHYTAPAGQQITAAAIPGGDTFALGNFLLKNFNVQGNLTNTKFSVSYDNLQGNVGSASGEVYSNPDTGFFVEGRASVSGSVSFTGFTVTVSNLTNIPSGFATYSDTPNGNYFDYSTNSHTDPGAFVSLQPTSAATTPEPGSVALLVGMGVSGRALLRRRRK